MNSYYKLYWLTRLDHLQDFIIGAAIISGIVFALYCFFYIVIDDFNDSGEEFSKNYGWIKKVAIPVFIFSVAINCFIPSKNEMIFIMAGGKTIDYIESDSSLQKLPYQATQIVSGYLDKKIEELKKESNSK